MIKQTMTKTIKKTSSRKTKTASKPKATDDKSTVGGSSYAKVDELCFVRGGSN